MSFALTSHHVMPPPLTDERLLGIKEVLVYHGVSYLGAEQFIWSKPIIDGKDRQKLLELINLVVMQIPGPSGDGRSVKSRIHGGKG